MKRNQVTDLLRGAISHFIDRFGMRPEKQPCVDAHDGQPVDDDTEGGEEGKYHLVFMNVTEQQIFTDESG